MLKYLKSVAPATRLSLKELSYKVTVIVTVIRSEAANNETVKHP